MAGKKPSHRNAIIRSQLIELIRNERLKSTATKTKILKAEFDKVVNMAKKGSPASRREVEATLQFMPAVEKLYTHILPRLEKDNSGYTISARTLPRKGDNATQVIVMIKGTEVKEKKSRIQATLEKQEKAEAAAKPLTSKIRNAVKSVGGAAKETKAKSSVVSVRRNSK